MPSRRERCVITLDDDVVITGEIERAQLDQAFEVDFAMTPDNGMGGGPNAAFSAPRKTMVRMSFTIWIDPETAGVWKTRNGRTRQIVGGKPKPKALLRADVSPIEKTIRADMLLGVRNLSPADMKLMVSGYKLLAGRLPPQRLLPRASGARP